MLPAVQKLCSMLPGKPGIQRLSSVLSNARRRRHPVRRVQDVPGVRATDDSTDQVSGLRNGHVPPERQTECAPRMLQPAPVQLHGRTTGRAGKVPTLRARHTLLPPHGGSRRVPRVRATGSPPRRHVHRLRRPKNTAQAQVPAVRRVRLHVPHMPGMRHAHARKTHLQRLPPVQ